MSLTKPHPQYERIKKRLAYVLDHYTGDVVDAMHTYLTRHDQGESDAAYKERLAISKYKPHFSFAIDSLAGQLFAKEDEAEREFGGVLGDPFEDGTTGERLWDDADGMGTAWLTMWKTLAPRLIACRQWWVLVEGVDAAAGREARVVLVDPRSVIDWIEEGGEVVEAVLAEEVETRTSVMQESKTEKQYVVYAREGWTVPF